MERKRKEMQKVKNRKREKCFHVIISIHTLKLPYKLLTKSLEKFKHYWAFLSRKTTAPRFIYLYAFKDHKFFRVAGF